MVRYLIACLASVLLLASCGRAPATAPAAVPGPRLEQTTDYLSVYHGDQAVLHYRLTPQLPDSLAAHYTRSGFFHPVYSPGGATVTDDFPAGYAHQHAIFTAWTNTTFRDSFVDFWNTHKERATVVHRAVSDLTEGGDSVGFTVTLAHQSLVHGAPLTVLEETLTVRVHDRNDVFVWDLRSEQENVTEDTLHLNRHLYGGLGVRGSKHWNPTDSVHFLAPAAFRTSQGLTRDSANHTRPAWTAISGPLPAGRAGLAVIPHPANFRWPQPVRVHPTLPYFSVSPVVEEGFAIAPGERYVARYRVVAFDGEVPERVLEDNKF